MSTTKPGLPQSPMKRMPKWLKITLSVFGVLFVLALIFGKSAPEQPTPPAAAPTTTISAPASKVPQPAEYVVAGIENGDTVELTGPAGTISARILGIETPPPTGDSCFRDEAYQWASLALSGKEVVAVVDEAQRTVVSLVFADGTDYVTQTLQTGQAKFVADAALGTAAAGLRTAEAAAKAAGLGLWAQPCGGVITSAPKQAAVPQPAPAPVPAPTKQAVPPQTTIPVEEPEPAAAYYKNCDAARAAGAAPLSAGDPGYSLKLDRDKDGIACE
ncbi:excalibur calcium-binding domain-containing protein [Saccharothrix sp. AJ9571]|nr:excalibur calcium-binding domain-containing protein [Saccharothrix sp. AJ9571]